MKLYQNVRDYLSGKVLTVHYKWARDYLNKPVDELEKGIESLDYQIKLHRDKIENPEKY